MRRIVPLVVGTLSIAAHAAATKGGPCSGDQDMLSIRGSWTTQPDVPGTTTGRPRSATPQVAARIDKLAQLFRAAYPDPRGMEAAGYRVLGATPEVSPGPYAYDYNSLYKAWYCNTNLHKVLLGAETATWAYAFVNHLGWFAEQPRDFRVEGSPTYLLTKRSGSFKGHPAYEGIHNQSSNTGQTFSRAILVTRGGRSPLKPVTRRQFLEAYLAYSQAQAGPQRAALEKYTQDPTKRAEVLRNFDAQVQKRESAARTRLSSLSPTEASQPAILAQGGVGDFKDFGTEERGGRALMRFDKSYFQPGMPPESPQFVVIYWRWQKSAPSMAFREEFEQRFDAAGVQALLDR